MQCLFLLKINGLHAIYNLVAKSSGSLPLNSRRGAFVLTYGLEALLLAAPNH